MRRRTRLGSGLLLLWLVPLLTGCSLYFPFYVLLGFRAVRVSHIDVGEVPAFVEPGA